MPRFLLLLSTIVLPGCVMADGRSRVLPDALPQGVQQPAASGDFASRLYEKLADAETDQNLIFSPFSVQVALAMCAVGAKGQTRDALADLIGAPRSVDDQNRQYAALLKSVNGQGKRPFELVTANALWGHHGYHFKPDYQKTLADFYDGVFQEVDFVREPNEAARKINAWASDRTHAKIKELVTRQDIKEETRLILTNAIYFKGNWEKQFKQSDTRDQNWYAPLRKPWTVPMMHQTGGFLYYEDADLQALEVPYKGGQLSLLVVLPRKNDGLKALEARWTSQRMYQEMTKRLTHEERVIVTLPRFKTEATFRLKSVLCSLGAGLAFDNFADFSGIGAEPLKISEVIHKAFVEVNEEGTEAAAATAVEMALATCPPPMSQPIVKIFEADHPFLFFIRDRNTNAVLFAGRVVDPK
jgi:serpin B